jgi:hypothetical protein
MELKELSNNKKWVKTGINRLVLLIGFMGTPLARGSGELPLLFCHCTGKLPWSLDR